MPKSYEPCYTRTDKSGGTYTTCEGAQKKRQATAKLKKGGAPPVMVKKKKKVGVDETPEQNSQKAFLKLQSRKISQGFAGNNTGRINTGPLNPANPNLSVNPWSVQPEIQAHQPTYEIDKGLFMEALATIVDVAQRSYFHLGPIDEDGMRKLTYEGVEYELEVSDDSVFDKDGDFVGKWEPKMKVIVFAAGFKRFHEQQADPSLRAPDHDLKLATYEERAKEVFERHKAYFKGNDHYAVVEIGNRGTYNWDGYNLYERGLFGKGSWVGTYENDNRLEEWRDYGRAQAFTKYDPLVLSVRSRGLSLIGFEKNEPAAAPKSSFTYEDMARDVFERRGERHAYAEISGIGKVLWDGYNLYDSVYGRAGKKIGTYEDVSDLTHWRNFGDEDFNFREPLFIPRSSKKLKLL
jgi:hypothetical protein